MILKYLQHQHKGMQYNMLHIPICKDINGEINKSYKKKLLVILLTPNTRLRIKHDYFHWLFLVLLYHWLQHLFQSWFVSNSICKASLSHIENILFSGMRHRALEIFPYIQNSVFLLFIPWRMNCEWRKDSGCSHTGFHH